MKDEKNNYSNPFSKGPLWNLLSFFLFPDKNLDKQFSPPTPHPQYSKMPFYMQSLDPQQRIKQNVPAV
jgi:hypothetical protein